MNLKKSQKHLNGTKAYQIIADVFFIGHRLLFNIFVTFEWAKFGYHGYVSVYNSGTI